jgi:hypothetical protein
MLKQFDRELVGLNYDLGHATIRGGSEWVQTSRFAHNYVHGLSVKDFRWNQECGAARRGGGGWPPRHGCMDAGNGARWRGYG